MTHRTLRIRCWQVTLLLGGLFAWQWLPSFFFGSPLPVWRRLVAWFGSGEIYPHLAPIFSLWFGLGLWSKVALGAGLVFFVVFFNIYHGVRETQPGWLANLRMLDANRRQRIWRLHLPAAPGWPFSSLHTAVGIAFAGVVVGEYLGSAQGIGYLILQAEGVFDIDTVLAGFYC